MAGIKKQQKPAVKSSGAKKTGKAVASAKSASVASSSRGAASAKAKRPPAPSKGAAPKVSAKAQPKAKKPVAAAKPAAPKAKKPVAAAKPAASKAKKPAVAARPAPKVKKPATVVKKAAPKAPVAKKAAATPKKQSAVRKQPVAKTPAPKRGSSAASRSAKVTAPAKKVRSKPVPAAEHKDADSLKRKYTRRGKKETPPVMQPKFTGKHAIPSKHKTEELKEQKQSTKHRQYSQKDLDYFREIILDKIRDANDELVSIEERLMDASTGEFHDDDSTYSLHMADQGTDAMEREKAFLFAQRERKFISHLSDALQRIKSGNYGICISCGDLIEKGRLEAVPHARMCVSCKNKTKAD